MRVVSVTALVIAIISLVLSSVLLVMVVDRLTLLERQTRDIEKEVEALGGWRGDFMMLEEGTLEADIPYGDVTAEGYQLFGFFTDRDDAERYVRSLANIENWGVMILQPDGDKWLMYREFPPP